MNVFVADRDTASARSLHRHAELHGHTVRLLQEGESPKAVLAQANPDLTFLDMELARDTGLLVDLDTAALARVVLLSARRRWWNDVNDVMVRGALYFAPKPLAPPQVLDVFQRAQALVPGAEGHTAEVCPGSSGLAEYTRERARRLKVDPFHVHVWGEAGLGKLGLARHLHAGGPCKVLHCAAVSSKRHESILFGEAEDDASGYWGASNGGALVLQDIAALSPTAQARLAALMVACCDSPRILSTDGLALQELMKLGRVIRALGLAMVSHELHVRPLRDRQEDVAAIFEDQWRQQTGGFRPTIAGEARDALARGRWSRNVDDVRALVEQLHLSVGPRGVVDLDALQATGFRAMRRGARLGTHSSKKDEFERREIIDALAETDENVKQAAAILGMSPRTLRRKINKHGLKKVGR